VYRIPAAGMAVLSLAATPGPASAQGFFETPEFLAPEMEPTGLAPADPGLGFGLGEAAAGAAANPMMTGLLALGVGLGLAAAAGGGGGDDDGDDGGGGGGDGGSGWAGDVLDGCTTANPARDAYETTEYYASYGLGVICAAERYAVTEEDGAPGFGEGVNVGVFDDGFYAFHSELRQSFGTTEGDNWDQVYNGYATIPNWTTEGNHGTHVAGTIGAARDGTGMHGVAPMATLYGIRGLADTARPWAKYDGFTYAAEFGIEDFEPNAIDPFEIIFSDGLHWASERGVEVMNHSWGFMSQFGYDFSIDDAGGIEGVRDYLRPLIFDAIAASVSGGDITVLRQGDDPDTEEAEDGDHYYLDQTTITGGMVHVFAAGNSDLSEPGVFAGLPYFGGAGSDFARHIVTVVSTDPDGNLSSFSNQCGKAKDSCLAAPGAYIYSTIERVVTDDDGTERQFEDYDYMSGTSMAAPHVTGSIALLLSEYAELTAADALQIIKDTATDIGAPGVDEVYGHGLLNLENAVRPQGALMVQLADTLDVDARPAAASAVVATGGMGRALGAALAPQPLMVTDRYDRGYTMSAAGFVAEADETGVQRDRVEAFATSQTRVVAFSDGQSELRFSPYGSEALALPGTLGDLHAPETAVLTGGAALTWQGDLGGGLSGMVQAAGPLGTAAAGATDGRYLGGKLALSLGGGASLSVGAGVLQESGGFLGTDLRGAFGSSVAAETAFVSLGAGLAVGQGRMALSYTEGVTGFSGDGLVQSGSGIGSRSLGVSFEMADVGARGARLGVGLRRSLDVTGGRLDLRVPVARTAAEGGQKTMGVVMQDASIDLDPARAPTDLELRYSLPAGPGQVGLALTRRLDEPADDGFVAGLGYRIVF